MESSDRDWADPLNERVIASPAPEPIEAKPIPPHDSRTPIAVGMVVSVVASFWFLINLNPAIYPTPWQGLILSHDLPYQMPLLWKWVGLAVLGIGHASALSSLDALSALLAGLVCGLLASLVASQTRRIAKAPEAAACGIAAAVALALSPAGNRMGTETSPTALTIVLAMGAFAALEAAIVTQRHRWQFASGFLVGLAASNHPSFGVFVVLLLIAAILQASERKRPAATIAVMTLGSAIGASVPLITALAQGQGFAGFVNHAFYSPHPTLGGGPPEWGFGQQLLDSVTPAVLIAAAIGLLSLFRMELRGTALVWASVFLLMGPFLPVLTNQERNPIYVNDPAATWMMAVMSVCAFGAWGIAAAIRVLLGKPRQAMLRAAIIVLVAVLATPLTFRAMNATRVDAAESFGRAVFDGCPQDTLLITGDVRLLAVLRTLQVERAVRTDVAIVPGELLADPGTRGQSVSPEASVTLSPAFPPPDAWDRWPLERPNEVRVLREKLAGPRSGRRAALNDLAMWEIMRDNFAVRPICFAGVSVEWLSARAQRLGLVLNYPRVASDPLDNEVALDANQFLHTANRELDALQVAVLLPLSESARRQGDSATAEKLAAMTRELAAQMPETWLTSAQTAARQGKRDQALAFVAEYMLRDGESPRAEATATLIESELRRDELVRELDRRVARNPDSPLSVQREIVNQLWELDELSSLRLAYQRAATDDKSDGMQLYEYAAILTQLGEFDEARQLLSEAAATGIESIAFRLQIDGRFSLLRVGNAGGELEGRHL